LTPLFDVPTPTGTGFTVQISNYDPSYVWAISLDQMGVKSISNTGLVTVGGIPYSTSVTATITTTSTNNLTSSADITTSALSACEAAVLCEVGDRGPGGGYIFLVRMEQPVGSQYFEAACGGWANNCDGSEDPFAKWGCKGTDIAGAAGTALGTGEQNTADILAGCNESGIAARLASDYARGAVDDWFLPTDSELDMLYFTFAALTLEQRKANGFYNFPGNYWMSVELSADSCRYMYMDQNGPPGLQSTVKDDGASFRPIRMF
jgi:hypothetical protein